jgi:hypothetical protein
VLLHHGELELPDPGAWRLEAAVAGPAGTAGVLVDVNVAPTAAPPGGIALAVVLLVIALLAAGRLWRAGPSPSSRALFSGLTTVRYFDINVNMKMISPRPPLNRLTAGQTHVDALKALAHLSRLQIFFALVKAGREMAVGEIQEVVEIPGATLSHHLDALRRQGSSRVGGKSGTSSIRCSASGSPPWCGC